MTDMTAETARLLALTPERLDAAHKAAIQAAEPYTQQMKRVVMMATFTALVAPDGRIIKSGYDEETERELAELRALAEQASSAAVKSMLGWCWPAPASLDRAVSPREYHERHDCLFTRVT